MMVLNILLAIKKMIIKPSCISLHQKSVYIKHFEKGGTKMSFIIKDDSVLVKNKEIWNNTKKA